MATLGEALDYQLARQSESQAPMLYTYNAVLISLASVAVFLRLLSRRLVKLRWQSDDYAIIVALILAFGMFGIVFFTTENGLGRHVVAVISQGRLPNFLKGIYAYGLMYALCIPTIKISFLLFYHRVFPDPAFRRLLWYVGLFMVLWCISAFFAAVFECSPVSFFWDKTVEGGTCFNIYAFYVAEGALTVFTDLVIITLPLPMVWRLQISTQQKLAVSGLFVLGAFVCVTSIIRIPKLNSLFTEDPTWDGTTACIWTLVECNIGIVSACLPLMRPIVRAVYTSKRLTWLRIRLGFPPTTSSSLVHHHPMCAGPACTCSMSATKSAPSRRRMSLDSCTVPKGAITATTTGKLGPNGFYRLGDAASEPRNSDAERDEVELMEVLREGGVVGKGMDLEGGILPRYSYPPGAIPAGSPLKPGFDMYDSSLRGGDSSAAGSVRLEDFDWEWGNGKVLR
ncbi:MAG: hypothetical protein M1817_002561 [Caeruleum heppii]|nr:MAG: hypothetical protein M1817_002561 [Caeruleum heppii]